MKVPVIILLGAVLAINYTNAVPCSDTVLNNCTDCTLLANAAHVDCTTTTTTTTVASITTLSPAEAARRRLLRRIRQLRADLSTCRRNAAAERAALLKRIKSLSSGNKGGGFGGAGGLGGNKFNFMG